MSTTTEVAEKNASNCCVETNADHQQTVSVYRPSVDILESADGVVLLADLPGVKPDGIDLHVEKGQLTLNAKVEQRNRHPHKLLRREYGVGDFQRTFNLSDAIDVENISAELNNGVLTITLPKTEAVKARKIGIKAS